MGLQSISDSPHKILNKKVLRIFSREPMPHVGVGSKAGYSPSALRLSLKEITASTIRPCVEARHAGPRLFQLLMSHVSILPRIYNSKTLA